VSHSEKETIEKERRLLDGTRCDNTKGKSLSQASLRLSFGLAYDEFKGLPPSALLRDRA